MGKQLEMFTAPPLTPDEQLNAAQAEMRRASMARDASRPGPRYARRQRSTTVLCPSCGTCVTINA